MKSTVEGDSEAIEIAEDLLYRSAAAVMKEDVTSFGACFQVPNMIETPDGQTLLETPEEVHAVFRNIVAYYKANKVTNLVRAVVLAEFVDDDTIGVTHVSSMLRADGSAFRKPFPCYGIVRKSDDGWKVATTVYAILDSPEHNRALALAKFNTLPSPSD